MSAILPGMGRRTDLHVVEHGPAEGTPIVAIHGWTPDHRLMTGFLERLLGDSGYRRIYPDLPAMGRSPVGAVSSTSDVVDEVEAVVDDRVGDSPFLLVGESYGGYVARELVRRRPGQVLGLALVCPIGRAVAKGDRVLPQPRVFDVDEALVASLGEEERAAFLDGAVNRDAETLARFREEIAPGLAAADEAGLRRIAQHWELDQLPEAGRTWDRPTLWLTGRQDDAVGYVDQWALLEHYPRATFAVLDRAGHNAQHDRADLVEALLVDWLERSVLDRLSGLEPSG